jgi:hypothetical protein
MTAPAEKCVRRLIDSHFAGTIAPREERAMRSHLGECAECRTYYERHLVVASLDPRAIRAEQRIATGLGLGPRRARGGTWTAAMALATAAFALFVMQSRTSLDFTPRGLHASAKPSFFAYRIDPAGKLDAQGGTIRATDDLAFAYTNPEGLRRLLVFGVDEHRHVYWYYPAWSDPSADPHAIAVDPGVDLRELPEAIRHEIDGDRLTIRAVFLDRDMSVRQVEQWVADPRTSDAPLPATAYEERVNLNVEH